MCITNDLEREPSLSERKCIVTAKVCSPDALIRFVRSPVDGQVVPDLANELPGRGVWIGNSQNLVRQAQQRKLFARGFKQPCEVPSDLDIRVAERLEALASGYLSLAKKAGQAVHGFEKVDAMISSGRIGVLIGASDGSLDGRSKLKQRARMIEPDVPVIESLASGQLGLALGRTNVIHAAMTNGGLAGKFVAAAHRAKEYRGSAGQTALENEEKA